MTGSKNSIIIKKTNQKSMKTISILGSTGSIGQSTLDIVRRYPDKFKVFGLSAHRDVDSLLAQIAEFSPKVVCLTDLSACELLKKQAPNSVKVVSGMEEIDETFVDPSVELVMMAISGVAALKPLISAIKAKKNIASANKEAVVSTGRLVLELAEEYGAKILPVDSEHSAIWQCLNDNEVKTVKKVHLTASGGSFRNLSKDELDKVTPEQAIHHPRWKMGKKITVDSGTLMNKGLELIEAMNLFNLKFEQIEVLVHPQSIIHSMVEYIDGTIMAQLGTTDMRIPIQYALSYPEKLPTNVEPIDFPALASLTFEKPKFENFPCLELAFSAAKLGGTMPCVLNTANEVAVDAFLNHRIRFTDIPKIVEETTKLHQVKNDFSLDDIFATEKWAREEAAKVVTEFAK